MSQGEVKRPLRSWMVSPSTSANVQGASGLPPQQIARPSVPKQERSFERPQPQRQVPGPKRVWVKRRGHKTATSLFMEPDELVDDLKSKVLLKFPTSLLLQCDPADLAVYVNESAEKPRPAKTNPPVPGAVSGAGPGAASGAVSAAAAAVSAASGNPPPPLGPEYPPASTYSGSPRPNGLLSVAKRNSPSRSPGANSGASSGAVELRPDELVSLVLERYFPNGMSMADAFEIAPRTLPDSVVPKPASQVPSAPLEQPPPPRPAVQPPARKPAPPALRIETSVNPVPAQRELSRPSASSNSMGSYFDAGAGTPATTSASASREPNQSARPSSSRTRSSQTLKKQTDSVLLLPRQLRVVGSDSSSDRLRVSRDESEEVSADANPIVESPGLGQTLKFLAAKSLPGTDRNVVVPQINVLIVEDNMINQKILEAFMRRKRVRYGVAKDGRDAVDKWRQGGFHLILMDIQLPVMTGLEATKEIRRLEYVNRIGAFSSIDVPDEPLTPEDSLDRSGFKSPIIIVALTASSASEDKSEALAAGCNDFLTKPVNLSWLEQKIVEWGCMQALVDFEGWKQWIRKDLEPAKTKKVTPPSPDHHFDRKSAKEALESQPPVSPRVASLSRHGSRSRSRSRPKVRASMPPSKLSIQHPRSPGPAANTSSSPLGTPQDSPQPNTSISNSPASPETNNKDTQEESKRGRPLVRGAE